ncbi:MAG: cytochrome c3 family protein [Bacteroidetes bacterium]|nr:cytochrome c3 family protein [Bacteroidota bacterium]
MMRRYLFILLIPVFAFTFPYQGKLASDEKKCTDCHSNLMTGKVAHPPATEGCDACHQKNENEHPKQDVKGFTLVQELPGLCYNCHTPNNTKTNVHPPVKNGKCNICHEPHSSDNAKLMKEPRAGTLCVACHDNLGIEEFKSRHKPVADLNCQDCHDPHQSDNPKLLSLTGTDLCLKCHTKMSEQINLPSVHPPFKNNCSICHSAHGSDQPFLVKKPTEELCVGCHDDFEEPLKTSATIHQPVISGKSCTNCHSAHASNTEKILLTDQKTLCLTCHSKPVKKGNRVIPNMKQIVEKSKYVHGAIENNGCTACHNPHFSNTANLLVGKFPSEFYTPAVTDSFALCFTCHDSQLMTEKTTTSATTFRNGDKNLHFVHINGSKGRTCKDCHEMHAGNTPHLIRESLTFGNWTMKIVYTASENGGTCQTGCHAVKTYTR